MKEFGVRFTVHDPNRFAVLQSLYAEVKRDKDAGQFRDPEEWVRMVPDEIKCRFSWPTQEQRRHWLGIRSSVVTAVPEPSEQLAAVWDFYRVFEAVDEGEYDVLGCELVGTGVGEMRINAHAYPYGGVGPLIALAEAFGFTILGVNEYGKYQTREELIDGAGGV
jgi:hypothetical protein